LALPRLFNGRLSALHPALYHIAVWARRSERWASWVLSGKLWCRFQSDESLPIRVKRSRSRLIKALGQGDLWMQHNKVANLRLAIPALNGLIIRPGETFSFCRRVGLPTVGKGYKEGMELSRGLPRPGIGGGICQLANMIHWLVLHSPLTVTERSEHSFDPFPDHHRKVPFGTGAAVFYNYVDLQFRNDTPQTFQLCLWMTVEDLCGELRADRSHPESFHVFEQNARFERSPGGVFRKNEIWRRVIDRRTGIKLREELLKSNSARVLYDLD